MNFEILISTLNNDPKKLVKKMGINSDAVIINQCDEDSYDEFDYLGHKIKVWNSKKRGIGTSRSMALKKSSGNIILFADDDEVLDDNYEKKILKAFEDNPKTDAIFFGFKKNKKRNPKKVKWYNCLKYGTAHLAIKKEKVLKNKIDFDKDFGASKYSHGEDSIFIYECIKSGIKFLDCIFIKIGSFSTERESTWFTGYDEKYFYDTGAIFARIFGKSAKIMVAFNILRKKDKNTLRNIRLAICGIEDYNNKKRKKL